MFESTSAITTHDLETAGRRIAWREAGQGRVTLLFVHAWCCNQDSWRHQMQAFSGRHRCLSLDLAGHGATSPLPLGATNTLADLAGDVNALRRAAQINEVILVGHSLGGPVAMEAAASMSMGVEGLIGVDTFTDERMYARRPADEIAQRLTPLEADFPGAIAGLVKMITFVDRKHTGVIDELIGTMTSVPLPTALDAMRRLLEWDIDTRWPLLRKLPACSINSRALLPLIAELPARDGLEIRLMDDVGHFPMLEDPDAFNVELGHAIASLQGG